MAIEPRMSDEWLREIATAPFLRTPVSAADAKWMAQEILRLRDQVENVPVMKAYEVVREWQAGVEELLAELEAKAAAEGRL